MFEEEATLLQRLSVYYTTDFWESYDREWDSTERAEGEHGREEYEVRVELICLNFFCRFHLS